MTSAPLPVVTLDGPAGVGKTTLARRMAESLGIAYLDTGAMFRCLALRLGAGADAWEDARLQAACAEHAFSLEGNGAGTRICCNGVPVRGEIRTEEVGMLAARLGQVPLVRTYLCEAQRRLAGQCPLVVEGRDMGTVVFPTARFKFFLDASPEVRALRRLRDLEARGQSADLAELTEQIRKRDAMDRNRPIAPLRAAPDAVMVDTSTLDIEGVLGTLLHVVNVHGGAALLHARDGEQ